MDEDLKRLRERLEHAIKLIEDLRTQLIKPCVYEARPLQGQSFNQQMLTAGAWCQTHGWNCPNVMKT